MVDLHSELKVNSCRSDSNIVGSIGVSVCGTVRPCYE